MRALSMTLVWWSLHLSLALQVSLGAGVWAWLGRQLALTSGLTSGVAWSVMWAGVCLVSGLGLAAWTWRARGRLVTLAASAWLCALGLILAHGLAPEPAAPAWLERGQQAESICGLVVSGPQTTREGWSMTLRPEQAPSLRVELSLPGPLFASTWRSLLPMPGDQLCAAGQLVEIEAPRAPWERDRRRLARWRGSSLRLWASELPHVVGRQDGLRWLAERVMAQRRLGVEARVRARHDPDRAALVLAMTMGSRGLLSPPQVEPFALSGTGHLLAISGLHLGLVAWLMWGLARLLTTLCPRVTERVGVRRLMGAALLCGLIGYVLAVGAPVSARRALAMALALLMGVALRRRLCPIHALALASTLILIVSPATALDPAYQLSVSATLGITLTARQLTLARLACLSAGQRPRADLLSKGLAALSVSASAWWMTSALVLDLNRELPLVGLALNMVCVPVVSVLVFPLMMVGLALVEQTPLPLEAAAQAMQLMGRLCELALDMPGAWWRPGALSEGWLAISALGALWAVAGVGQSQSQSQRGGLAHASSPRALSLAWRAVGLVVWLGALLVPSRLEPAADRLDLLPVGQGDATLIITREGASVLLDGGGALLGADPGRRVVLPALRQRGVHRLDAVVLTHPDLDHIEGLFAVARWATPARFYYHAQSAAHERLAALIEAMRARGAIVHGVDAPWLALPQSPALTVWRPPSSQATSDNDRSLTLILERDGFRAALTGDLEVAGERALLRAGLPKLTLWKLGHHGSRTSSGPDLLARASPSVAVVSCGLNNRHGHPHPEVMARLAALKVPVWRTDEQGLVTITLSQGGRWRIQAMRPSLLGSERSPMSDLL